MPFINGRYYVNPIMGEALETAREAETALLALENRARQNSGKPGVESAGNADDGFGDGSGGNRRRESGTTRERLCRGYRRTAPRRVMVQAMRRELFRAAHALGVPPVRRRATRRRMCLPIIATW
jgi:hypothetical protein